MILQSDFEQMTEQELQKKYDDLVQQMDHDASNLAALPLDGGTESQQQTVSVLLGRIADAQSTSAMIHTRLKAFETQAKRQRDAMQTASEQLQNRQWRDEVAQRQQSLHDANKRHYQQGWGNSVPDKIF